MPSLYMYSNDDACICTCTHTGLRFITDKVQAFPMIGLRHQDESASTTGSTDSDGQEDNYEQGDNSYELHPLFGKGWKMTTTV